MQQLLHHTFTYGKQSCSHAVSDTKALLSCPRMCFSPELLDAYGEVMRLIFGRCLQPFYGSSPPHKDLAASEEVMATIERAVEVNNQGNSDRHEHVSVYLMI